MSLEARIVNAIGDREVTCSDIENITGLKHAEIKSIVSNLCKQGALKREEHKGFRIYQRVEAPSEAGEPKFNLTECETLAEMRKRHAAERFALLRNLSEAGLTQLEAAAKLKIAPSNLASMVKRAGLDWKVKYKRGAKQ